MLVARRLRKARPGESSGLAGELTNEALRITLCEHRWLVAKFGGTSVGKFLDNIALQVVP
jgi:hypothetical protein